MLPRPYYLIWSLVITSVLLYVGFVRLRYSEDNPDDVAASCSKHSFVKSGFRTCNDNLLDVQNSTLGFQEIVAISLPERTDKRDALVVQAALTDITLKLADGIDGKNVPYKALPYTMDQSDKVVGCWRAHLSVLEDMVARKVDSLLLFEDDADWDVSLKYQLIQFARGSRYLLNTSRKETPHSPYGDGWDLLWLGHCGLWSEKSDNRRFVIPHDPTAVRPEYRKVLDDSGPKMTRWETGDNADPHTRVIFRTEGAVCTAAYAVSLRGAEKILYHMSMLPYNSAVDWGLHDMCREKKSGFTCISTNPVLVGSHRPAGNTSKWSDIGYGSDADRGIEEKAFTENIVFSTRLNTDRLLTGSTRFRSQWGTDDLVSEEMDMEQIRAAVGHPEQLSYEEAEYN